MYEITGHYVDVMGLSVYYEEAGEGDAVVCLAMAGASGSQYHDILELCAGDRYRFIALDMPGRGKTLPNLKTLKPIDRADEYLAFIWAFIEALNLEKVIILGTAMTATAALLLAAEHPETVSAVIACNGGVVPKAANDPAYSNLLNHPGINLSDFKEAHIPGLCGADIPQENLNLCIWYGAKTQVCDTATADVKVFSELSIEGKIRGLKMPVLLLNGGEDKTISEKAKEEILSLPAAVGREIPGAGHYMILEKPRESAEAIRSFLETL